VKSTKKVEVNKHKVDRDIGVFKGKKNRKEKSQLDIDIENFERNESEERKKQEKLQKEL